MDQVISDLKPLSPLFDMKVMEEHGTFVDVRILIPENDDQAIELEEALAMKLENILVDFGYYFNCFPYVQKLAS